MKIAIHVGRCLAIGLLAYSSARAADVPRVTVATKRFGGVQLMSIGIDGSNPVQLTDEPDDATQPTWCPDGTKLAYVVGARSQGRIKVMDANGQNSHFLFEGGGFQRTPQWSPDGKQIAFSMNVPRYGTDNVFVINADGVGMKNLIDTRRFAADPAWSPDGSRIAFVSAIVGRAGRLTVMNTDGTNQTDVLGHDLHVAVYPAWTSDGKQITYGAPDENRKVQVMQANLDGSGKTELTHGPREHSYAAWSSDGQYLAYVSDPGAATGDLCIYDVLAGEHRTVLKSEVFQELFRDARPSWVPKTP
jgi:Tol biopolymer transport system component